MAVYSDGSAVSLYRFGDVPVGAYTFTAWVRRDATGGADIQHIGGFGGYSGNSSEIRSYGGAAEIFGNQFTAGTDTGAWLFVAETYDPDTQELTRHSRTLAGSIVTEAPLTGWPPASGGTLPGFSLFCHADAIDGVTVDPLKGHLAGVKCWSRILTPTELLDESEYLSAVDRTDLFAEYTLDGASTATVDTSDNARTLTLSGTLVDGLIPDPVPLVPDTPVAISGTAAGDSTASIIIKARWGGVLNPHYSTELDGDVCYNLEGRPYWDAEYSPFALAPLDRFVRIAAAPRTSFILADARTSAVKREQRTVVIR